MKSATQPVTLGLIVGNRGFFPAHLAESGRKTILKVLEEEGFRVIALSPEETLYGSVVTHADAHKCADLFKRHRDEIDGVLVTLPNFGEERAIADTLRWSGLDVPVLIQAFPDDPNKMTVADRRDSFCGKMSACNNLRQYGIKYSLTTLHTVDPESESFRQDLARFAGICRIVRGFKNARVGVIGARPAAFNTVRFSEKLLERSGISVETLDLSEVFGRIQRLDNEASVVKEKLAQIERYVQTAGVPQESLLRMAKFGAVVDEWMKETELTASAIQCWTAMEEYYGVVPCTLMSIMSDGLMPSACETDIAGTVAMMALAFASGKPSAIVDWNNNYGDDPDKAIIFHCSNLPKSIFVEEKDVQAAGGLIRADDIAVMDFQEIIAGTVGKENTFGTIVGRVKAEPFTYLRVSTDDLNGRIIAYVGEGELTNDPIKTFGGYGVVRVPRLQELLHYICENGYEHHVAMNLSQVAASVHEALNKYMGWSTYWHKG
ncbi:L-fucose/L-arabinose isomerase family protein [Caldilinea sp.]|uniref:Fucose isomerase n=1 Tax=Caldilinea aerophila TaxID=133453 RepID=A0A7C1FVQ2_9CHLR|nr:L-fucose/L-arabinose isomerase family protein [Caldilinea sp.]GIV72203.1 MAG: fucose isomerase [Caldilinea sp.]